MTHTDIKKSLYKQNPTANFMGARKGHLTYNAIVSSDPQPLLVWFDIPFSDVGDGKFFAKMDSKLLIRWLVIYGTENENV
jgi:hypothetical protein